MTFFRFGFWMFNRLSVLNEREETCDRAELARQHARRDAFNALSATVSEPSDDRRRPEVRRKCVHRRRLQRERHCKRLRELFERGAGARLRWTKWSDFSRHARRILRPERLNQIQMSGTEALFVEIILRDPVNERVEDLEVGIERSPPSEDESLFADPVRPRDRCGREEQQPRVRIGHHRV